MRPRRANTGSTGTSLVVRLLLGAALLGAGCSGASEVAIPAGGPTGTPTPPDTAGPPTPEPTLLPTPPPSPTPVPDPEGRAELPDDLTIESGERLVVQDRAGHLYTMLPDGSNVIPLTDPGEAVRNIQPTWSPDAGRIGWVAATGGGPGEVRSARFDGTDWFHLPTADAPFYLSWDPTSTQLASLSPGRGGFDLTVIDVVRTGTARLVDQGSPYWFAWGPDGESLFVHASGLRLDRVPVDGPSVVLEGEAAPFQAPAWINSPRPLLYADEVDGSPTLVTAGPDGEGRFPLISYDGYLQFVVSPVSGFIALQVIDESEAPVPAVITALHRQEDPDIVDAVARDQLIVMAVFGGEPITLTENPVVAFSWSPDGTRLAWLESAEPGDPTATIDECADPRIEADGVVTSRYRWWFWDGSQIGLGPEFRPSHELLCSYLPFFDQYTQSHTFWSPDGTQFVYAGAEGPGPSEIWVTPTTDTLNTGSPVGPGVFAAWSPTAAGSAATITP